jgi:diguanylate cyclase (GGDEF)-like protein/PAS domain S-box-containing protein
MEKMITSVYRPFLFALIFLVTHMASAITPAEQEPNSVKLDGALYMLAESVLLILTIMLAGYIYIQNRKLRQALLKSLQSEDRLQTLYTAIEQSPVSVIITNLDGHIQYANPYFTQLTGYSLMEVFGQNTKMLGSGFTDPAVFKNMWKMLVSGNMWSGELINRRKNGDIYWEYTYISPVYNKKGKMTQYVAVKLDITERKRREQHEHSLTLVLDLLSKNVPLKDILHAIIHSIETQYPDMMCSILLLDKKGSHLRLGAAPSLPDFFNQAVDGIEIGHGVGSCGTAVFSGQRVIVEDIATHPYWAPYLELATRAGLGSCWSQPILSSEQKMLGTFAIYHSGKHVPQEDDIRLIDESAKMVAIAIERFQAKEALRLSEEKHRLLAYYDALTGLPTRTLFSDRLKQAIRAAKRNETKLALMFLDFDKFKPVNDSFGHAVGDLLLKEAAERMLHCVRETDTVCRIGGDEFIILIPEIADAQNALQIADKIRIALNQPFAFAGEEQNISCSIGISLYPDHGTDEITLTKNADQAMYRAKENGRNQAQVF